MQKTKEFFQRSSLENLFWGKQYESYNSSVYVERNKKNSVIYLLHITFIMLYQNNSHQGEPLLVSKIWVGKVPKVHKSDKCRIILIVRKSFEYLFIEYDGKVSNPTIELEKFRKIFCLKPYVLVEAVRTCFKLIYCEISICHHII